MIDVCLIYTSLRPSFSVIEKPTLKKNIFRVKKLFKPFYLPTLASNMSEKLKDESQTAKLFLFTKVFIKAMNLHLGCLFDCCNVSSFLQAKFTLNITFKSFKCSMMKIFDTNQRKYNIKDRNSVPN